MGYDGNIDVIFLIGWWTINLPWYHLHSSQCFGTAMVYKIY